MAANETRIAVVLMREDVDLDAWLLCCFCIAPPIGGTILTDCNLNSSLLQNCIKNSKNAYNDPSWNGMVIVEKEKIGRKNLQTKKQIKPFNYVNSNQEKWERFLFVCLFVFYNLKDNLQTGHL